MERIIICIVLLPLVLALVYTVMYPEESKLFRSRYRDDDDSFETNGTVVKRNRIIGIIALAAVAAIYVLCILGW